MLISWDKENSKIKNKNWLTKILLISTIIIIMFVNIKIFIVQVLLDNYITPQMSFEERYNIYEKCNNMLPYNRVCKENIIRLIEAYEYNYPDKKIEYSKKVLEYSKDLLKFEKYYNRFNMQTRLVIRSIDLFETENIDDMIKNIEDGLYLIKNYKIRDQEYINLCLRVNTKNIQIGDKLLNEYIKMENLLQREKIKELAKKFYKLNIDKYEEDKKVFENKLKNASDEEKDLLFEMLLNYKEDALKKIGEN